MGEGGRQPRLLIVDDDEGVRELLGIIFESEDVECVTAGTIGSAVDICRRNPPDLILLDKNLPDGSAFDFMHMLQESNHQCVVLLMSAHADFASATEALKLGIKEVLIKPFEDVGEVRDNVMRRLARLKA